MGKTTLTPLERKLLIRLLKQLVEEEGEGVMGETVGVPTEEKGAEVRADEAINNTLRVLRTNLQQVRVAEVFISDLNIKLGDLELTGEGDIFRFQGTCEGTYTVIFRIEPRIGTALENTIAQVGPEAWRLTWEQRRGDIQAMITDTVQRIINEIVQRVREIRELDRGEINIDTSGVGVSGNPVGDLVEIGMRSIERWMGIG